MLTDIVKATRAHYAALQHKPAPDRIPLDYVVDGHGSGTIHVKAPNESRRRAEITKLLNRLRSMYPEVQSIEVTYRRTHWKPEVQVDGQWCANSLVFETEEEARSNARDLMGRWMLVTDYRAVPSDLPVNYHWINGKLESLKCSS